MDKTNLDTDNKLVATHYNTLWDKFGFPLNLPATISDDVTPIAYLQRGYNSIYNEWIRDENSDSEVDLTSNAIQTCCYKRIISLLYLISHSLVMNLHIYLLLVMLRLFGHQIFLIL